MTNIAIISYTFLVLCFLFPTHHAFSQDDSILFPEPDSLQARYEEEKYFPDIPQPIRSEGDFIYLKGRGLAWIMDKPFKMRTIITSEGLFQWINGEKQVQSADLQKNMRPLLKNISAIFSGDEKAISSQFEIKKCEEPMKVKCLVLIPKSEQLQPFLQEIVVQGKNYIQTVKIVFSKKKYTLVRYKDFKIGEHYIDQKELKFFEQ